MDILRDCLEYVRENPERFRTALRVHVELSLYALLAAILIFVPLGVLASRSRRFLLYPYRQEVGALVPFWSPSFVLSLVALVMLAGPPLIINTDAGLRAVDAAVLENGRGLGMTEWQLLTRVQAPLALPVIVAGVRAAAVEVVASATLAAFVGAGTLGRFITSGFTLLNYHLLFVGAIPVAVMAVFVEITLAGAERLVTPPNAP
jgi:osmoprotectant transport system permease protein